MVRLSVGNRRKPRHRWKRRGFQEKVALVFPSRKGTGPERGPGIEGGSCEGRRPRRDWMELRGHLSSSSRPAGKSVYAEAGELAGDTRYMALRAGRGLGTLSQQGWAVTAWGFQSPPSCLLDRPTCSALCWRKASLQEGRLKKGRAQRPRAHWLAALDI